jgi:hypothetical protein
VSDRREYPALEPLAYRWRPRGGKLWIYDPTLEWIEDHRNEVDIEPLYGPDEIASLRAQLASAGEHIAEMTDQLASARKAVLQEAIDVVQRYDDCGAQFIIEKLQALSLTDEKGKS